MASKQCINITLADRPEDNIETGKTFATNTISIPSESSLKDGQVLVKTLYLSLDPAMRGWIRDRRSYVPPVKIGEVMRGGSVCEVMASRSSKFKPGQLLQTGALGWTEYGVVREKDCLVIEDTGAGRRQSAIDSLGVLGMPGLTAYFGLIHVGEVKKGDFVMVSGAAGATGSVVGQIAKLKGATVIGIAGGPQKCAWLKDELGFDDALDYKAADFAKKFRSVTKDRLIDLFYDNTGGEALDLAFSRARPHARFVICGGISQYNSKIQKGPVNFLNIVSFRLTVKGFIVFDFKDEYPRARKDLAQWLREGKIKRTETIVTGGLTAAESALKGLFEGQNTGKMLVEVAPLSDNVKSRL